jgi:RNase H-fold protein (predicted Holliday junction resolvase)
MNVLGLDISTSIVGICVYTDSGFEKITHSKIAKIQDFFKKVDAATDAIEVICKEYSIDKIIIEEPLKRFSAGKSSAQTIVTLIRFNGALSYSIYKKTGIVPEYISASTSRKMLGIKLFPRKIVDKSQKEQTRDWMMSNLLANFSFDKTKNGTYKDYVSDQVDAAVLAAAGYKKK